MLKCPVCKNDQHDGSTTCTVCGFPQLNRSFLNSDEAKFWLENTVDPCRAVWHNCKKYRPIGYQQLSYRQYPTEIGSFTGIERSGLVYAITSSNYEKLTPIQIEGTITNNAIQHFTASSFCQLDNVDDNLGHAIDFFLNIDDVKSRLKITQARVALEYRLVGSNTPQECPCLASVIAMYSLLRNVPFMSNTMFVGEMSISGKIKPCNEVGEILEICSDLNVRRIILPITAAMHLSNVSVELLGKFSLVFYSDAKNAIAKALQLQSEDVTIE